MEVTEENPKEARQKHINRVDWGNLLANGRYRMVVAGLIALSFLTLTVPHSYEILSHFEKPDTHWLGWFYAFGLELGAAFAAFIVCEKSVRWWARVLAGLMLAGAISGSYLLNLSYYLANGAKWEHAVGLAALLPGFIALLGGMLPGLAENAQKMHQSANERLENAQPVQLIDPLPMMQEAFNAMERSIEQRMAEIDTKVQHQNAQNAQVLDEAVQSLAKLPDVVHSQLQKMHFPGGEMHAKTQENALNVQSVAKSLEELGRKLQRREIKIAEFDRAVVEVLEQNAQQAINS